MAQTFTLEESAQRLGLSVEEFKRKLRTEWQSVRSFRDGPTLRFRAADIDELARTLGQASDPGLVLGGGNPLSDSDEDSPLITIVDPPKASKSPSSIKKKQPIVEEPFNLDIGDEDTDDIMFLDEKSSSSKGDSDVRLDLTPPAYDPNANQPTEEITFALDPAPRSGVMKSPSSVKLTNPSSAKITPLSAKLSNPGSSRISGPGSSKIPGPTPSDDEGSSEFELNIDADSDSFELNLNDSSEEVSLGGEPEEGPRSGRSGINLGKPSDSGVLLDKKGKPPIQPPSKPSPASDSDSDSDIDFELSIDEPGQSGNRLAGPKSAARKTDDSDSEFELSLDDNSGITDALADNFLDAEDESKGDIFETDFELPPIQDDESGSEVVAIESSDTDLENSDFDIAIDDSDIPLEDESASQVVLVDDEDAMEIEDEGVVLEDDDEQPVARKSGKARKQAFVDVDDVEDADAVEAVDDEDEGQWTAATKDKLGDDDEPIRTGGYMAPPRWGPLPAILLLPCLLIVLIGGMMSFEMIRGQWGYQQPNKPSDSLVRGLAGQFGFKTSD